MYNCHQDIFKFYDEKVRLRDKHTQLREFRDRNLERVKDGTRKLREKDKTNYPMFVEDFSQGSMAMHTINQAQNEDDHDIDHALIYEETSVSDTKGIKEFVARAISESGGNFVTEPEARTNAVTVWYQDGHHVDFAIYKRTTDLFGNYSYHHAGEMWTKREPRAITEWFLQKDKSLSPSGAGITVETGQLRRIVRLLKFWSKSRATWSLPSGLVLSVLVADHFVKDSTRDDVAFYETIKAIRQRLLYNKDIPNPVDRSISLLVVEEHHSQMDSLLEKLNDGIEKLEPLIKYGCSSWQASRAWAHFFNNNWWSQDLNKTDSMESVRLSNSITLPFSISTTISGKHGGRSAPYNPQTGQTIAKGMNLKFVASVSLARPYSIDWEVRNKGDEARWKNQDQPRPGVVDPNNDHVCNETTAFRGNHLMICKVTKESSEYKIEIPIRIR